MKLDLEIMLSAVEADLQSVISEYDRPGYRSYYEMLAYQMGWSGEGTGLEARGKRIRPMLVLLTTSSAGGNWRNALPAASAIELIHNFSLIHDDIEDQSETRRNRLTVWKKWGIAQAVNIGDAMFSIANRSILRLENTTQPQIALSAGKLLAQTCINLTQGQYLDLDHESDRYLDMSGYLRMIAGKTAAVFSACSELGSMVAQAEDTIQETYRQFGYNLGIAFQVQDDYLGIWGDEKRTGKSASSDLLAKKCTLPIIHSLKQGGKFAESWEVEPITQAMVPKMAQLLEEEGSQEFTKSVVTDYSRKALDSLRSAKPEVYAGMALEKMVAGLLNRDR